MKVVYIAGHYRTKSILKRIIYILRARRAALFYWRKGYAVLCPHSNTAFFDGKAPKDTFLKGYLEFVRRSDIIVMLTDWTRSPGSQEEHALALQLHKEIIFQSKGFSYEKTR